MFHVHNVHQGSQSEGCAFETGEIDRLRYSAAPHQRPGAYLDTETRKAWAKFAVKHECAARSLGVPYTLGQLTCQSLAALGDVAYTTLTTLGSSIASVVTCCKSEGLTAYTGGQWVHCAGSVADSCCIPIEWLCCGISYCSVNSCCPKDAAKQTLKDIAEARASNPQYVEWAAPRGMRMLDDAGL